MIRIAVDGRVLLKRNYTGISFYLKHLLRSWSDRKRSENFHIYVNQLSPVTHDAVLKHYDTTQYRIPNKLLNFLLLTIRQPSFRYGIREPILFMPNLNYCSLPESKKLILAVHDLSFIHFPQFFSLRRLAWHRLIRFKALLNAAYRIVTDSYFIKNDLLATYPFISEKKVSVIHLGIDKAYRGGIPDTSRTLDNGDGIPHRFILYYGTLEPRKNIPSIIAAFNYCAKKDQELHLVLGGATGWLVKEIFRSIKRSPYRRRIHYTGYLSEHDKITLLTQALVFVYPSFYEGFGLPPLEALASGCPVVASSAGSLPEVLGDAALLVNPHAPYEIAEAVKTVIKDRTLAQQLSEKGSKRARGYAWDSTADKLFSLFTEIYGE